MGNAARGAELHLYLQYTPNMDNYTQQERQD